MSQKMVAPDEINQNLYKYDKLARYIPNVEAIDENEIRNYHEQGYIAVENVFNEQEVNAAKEALDRIILKRSQMTREEFDAYWTEKLGSLLDNKGEGAIGQNGRTHRAKLPLVQLVKKDKDSPLETFEDYELATRKIAEFVDLDDALFHIAYHPKLLAAIEKIFGEPAKLVQNMALLKPPFGGGEKPWHQDMAYRGLDFDKPVIGVWLALDPAEIDNGCMHIIPRSHMDGGTPHYAVRDWQICDEKVDVPRDVVVPLDPGGLLFFHGMTHHGTPNNLSEKRRKALQLHYAPQSAVQLTPQEYKRVFTNEYTNATC